jgi:hypothetical protein
VFQTKQWTTIMFLEINRVVLVSAADVTAAEGVEVTELAKGSKPSLLLGVIAAADTALTLKFEATAGAAADQRVSTLVQPATGGGTPDVQQTDENGELVLDLAAGESTVEVRMPITAWGKAGSKLTVTPDADCTLVVQQILPGGA